MIQGGQKVKIRIIKIGLDVKFPCTMNIQSNKEVLASSLTYEDGAFIFNYEYEIVTSQKSQTPFWQALVVLKSNRGANYNSGIIRLRISDLLQQKLNIIKVYPLSKCYDPEAHIQFIILNATKSALGMMLSQPKLMTVYENSRSGSDIGIHKQRSQAQYTPQYEEYKDNKRNSVNQRNKQYVYENIVQKLQAQHAKQKMQEQIRILKQKSNKIKQLQRSVSESQEQSKRLRQQVIDLQQLINQKQTIIQQLQQQLQNLHMELESATSLLQQKQFTEKINEKNYENNIKEIQMSVKIRQDQKIAILNHQINQITNQNLNLKAKLQNKQKKSKEYLNLLQQNENKIQRLQIQCKKSSDHNLQLETKIKQIQYLYQIATKQKEDYQFKNRQFKKQLDLLKSIKKSYRVLQDELNIVKKKAESSVKQSSSTLQRMNIQYKKKIQKLTQQLKTTNQQLTKVESKYQELHNVTTHLNEKIQHKQTKHKQISKQLITTQQKANLIENNHLQAKSIIQNLNQNCQQMKIKLQQYERTQFKLKQANQILESQLEKQKNKIKKMEEDMNLMKFQLEKYKLALTINQFDRDNTHLSCKNKQQQLNNSLHFQQEKNISLQTALTQLKYKKQQSERLLHQLRLQETKHRQQISKLTQRYQASEKKIAKFEQQIKQTKIIIMSTQQQRNKLIQIGKQNDNKLMQLTLIKMQFQQKNTKLMTQEQISTIKLKQMEEQLKQKQQKIEQYEANELDLRRKWNNQKQKVARLENEVKIVKRQLQRYINKIRVQVSHCIKIQQNQQPVESLIKHHKNAMLKLSTQVTSAAKELQDIKIEMEQKNRIIIQLQQQLQSQQLQIANKDNNIECLQQLLDGKQQNMTNLNEQHSQLIGIHEQYIFSFNRYKIDKQEEVRNFNLQIQQLTTKIQDLDETKNMLDTEVQNKILQINMLKQINFQLQSKVKVFLKQIDKYDIDIKQIYSQLQIQQQKNNKLGNQIVIHTNKNHMLVAQNQLLTSKMSQLLNEQNQNKQMVDMITKSKQKIMKENAEKAQSLMTLQFELHQLRLSNDGLEQQQKINKQQIYSLKQNLKNTKTQSKLLDQQLNTLKQIHFKLQNKYKQKSFTLGQYEKRYSQNQAKLKLQNKNLNSQLNQLQQNFWDVSQKHQKLKILLQKSSEQHLNIEKQFNQQLNNLRIQKIKLENEKQKLKDLYSKQKRQLQEFEQEKLRMLAQLQSLKNQNESYERDLSEKELSLYTVTGKLNQLQMNWKNQQKNMVIKIAQYEQQMHLKIQQISMRWEQKAMQAQNKKSAALGQIQNMRGQLRMKRQRIQKLEDQLEEIQDHCYKKINIYENQMSAFNSEMNEKIQNVKRQLFQKEKIINILKAQKDAFQFQIMNYKVQNKQFKQQIITKANQINSQNEKVRFLQNKKLQLEKKVANYVRIYKENMVEIQKDIKKEFEILTKGSPNLKQQHNQKILEIQNRIIRITQQRNI